jgi:hypothetical protein
MNQKAILAEIIPSTRLGFRLKRKVVAVSVEILEGFNSTVADEIED